MTTLYAAGYSGLKVADLAAWLVAQDAILADIRLHPSSMAPQWRQLAMRKAFGDRYLHIPALGNQNYKRGGIRLADAAAGVAAVADLLRRQPVLLLCVCEHYATCHRSVAAEAIRRATGVEVVHLTRADFGGGMRQLKLL